MADLVKHCCFALATDEVFKNDNLKLSFLNGDWMIEICLNRDNEEFPFAECGVYLCKDSPTRNKIFVTSRTSIILWDNSEHELLECESFFDDKISSNSIWSTSTNILKDYVSYIECYRSVLKMEMWFSDRPQKKTMSELTEGPLTCLNRIESGLESLSSDFSGLLKRHADSDVVLKAGTNAINAHKLVLSARSDVFKAMFHHDVRENALNIVEIEDFDFNVLDIFVCYLYTGRFPTVGLDVVSDLYRISDKYSVCDLKHKCHSILLCSMSCSNVCNVLSLADYHNDHLLKSKAVDFVVHNEDALYSEEWTLFSEERPLLAVEVYRAFLVYLKSNRIKDTLVEPKNPPAISIKSIRSWGLFKR